MAALNITPREKDWLRSKWNNIRASQRAADIASREWKTMNDAVNDWLTRSGHEDPLQRAKIKGENLALKDALSTHKWHSEEASRHIHDVQLFLRMKELGVL